MRTTRTYFLAIVAMIFFMAGCVTTQSTPTTTPSPPTVKSTVPTTTASTAGWAYDELFDQPAEFTSQNTCVNIVIDTGTGKFYIKCASRSALANFIKNNSRQEVEKMKKKAQNSPDVTFGKLQAARICNESLYR